MCERTRMSFLSDLKLESWVGWAQRKGKGIFLVCRWPFLDVSLPKRGSTPFPCKRSIIRKILFELSFRRGPAIGMVIWVVKASIPELQDSTVQPIACHAQHLNLKAFSYVNSIR